MTLSVTVRDVDRPVLGFTVTVTVQEPSLSPFKVDTYTLHNFDDLLNTFNDVTDPAAIVNFAKLAIDFAVADLFNVTVGAFTAEFVLAPATVTVRHPVQFPALSLTRISTDVAANFCKPLDETDSDKSAKGTDTLVA